MNKPIVTKKLLLAFHAQQANQSQRDLANERNAVERQRLIHKYEWHRAAVRVLDREAEYADKRARQSCSVT